MTMGQVIMLQGMAKVFVLFVILFSFNCRAPNKDDPSAPLSKVQESEIIRALALSDRLDVYYGEKQPGKEFISSATRLQVEAATIEGKLPRNNATRALFVNTIKAYGQATEAALKGANSGGPLPQEKLDALFSMAGKRKALLRKVLSGKLNEEEEKLFKQWATTP